MGAPPTPSRPLRRYRAQACVRIRAIAHGLAPACQVSVGANGDHRGEPTRRGPDAGTEAPRLQLRRQICNASAGAPERFQAYR